MITSDTIITLLYDKEQYNLLICINCLQLNLLET